MILHATLQQLYWSLRRLLQASALTAVILVLLWFSEQATPVVHAQERSDGVSAVYLPVINNGLGTAEKSFAPTAATELAGGSYTFDAFTISTGVTVTVTGPVTITVRGDAIISGTFIGDCHAIFLQSQGTLQLFGTVDNRCQDANTTNPGLLTLYGNGEAQVGTVGTPAIIESSGDINLSNDPTLAVWQFDLLEEQRSAEPLPPVCAAEADTTWDTLLPDTPATIRFSAHGIDPDGGPVTFAWDFGDGASIASGADVLHNFTVAGAYTITLTAADNDGQQCQATLGINFDDSSAATPDEPALQMQPLAMAVATGEAVDFAATAIDAESEILTYTWTFGDGDTSALITSTHTYSTPGRYPVTLSVRDEEGNLRQATASLYIYPAAVTAAATAAPLAVCPPLNPLGSVLVNGVFNPGPAAPGRDGRTITHIWRGNVIINRGVQILGQDGGNGLARAGVGTVRGQRGGNGGGVRFLVHGTLTVCSGVTLAAGDGGAGGAATATANPGATAHAYGGNGGRAGSHALFVATNRIDFEEPGITVDGGDGGQGGAATATGGDGQDRCASAQHGGAGYAYGGAAGAASKAAIARGQVNGTANVTLTGGLGGDGGAATATGGRGGHATCVGTAHGGNAGRAYTRAGQGGNAYLTGQWRVYTVAAGAFTAGDGGIATADGGQGGNGNATPAAACAATTATSGAGGPATAYGGHGGRGRTHGAGRSGHAFGGNGGLATAKGGDCTACGKGGDASATAGLGGSAYARAGHPALIGDNSTATAGDGGAATAKGGSGGDCPDCPGGKGGDGGVAMATGGDGGQAGGRGLKLGGNGGLGDATGGEGGNGADCCGPPDLPGGNGGNGGPATSKAGKAGSPGGLVGGNATGGGNGGNGGDGEGPGGGGAGGIGVGSPVDIFDGFPGLQGEFCPKPTPTITVTVPPDPTPEPTTTPVPPVITGIDVRVSTTQTTPSQPVNLVAKALDQNGQVFDALSFFDVFVEVRFAENPTGQRIPAHYGREGCYQLVLPLGQPGSYQVVVLFVRKEDGSTLHSEPVLITVIGPENHT